MLIVSGGSQEAFSEEAALQKHFDPRRERASHRGKQYAKGTEVLLGMLRALQVVGHLQLQEGGGCGGR